MSVYRYAALRASQAADHDVFVFAANPNDVLAFAQIERVGRSDDGQLKGFQRHQIASHIRDIRDYLSRDHALLPNAVIVAFIDGVKVKDLGEGRLEVCIDGEKGPPGFVVDGRRTPAPLPSALKKRNAVPISSHFCCYCKQAPIGVHGAR